MEEKPETEKTASPQNFGQRLKSKIVGSLTWKMSREVWDDHDFWLKTIATKGGAYTILATAVYGISFAATLPFLPFVAGLAVCGALIGIGGYVAAVGTRKMRDGIKDAYYRVNPEAKKRAESRLQKKPMKEHLAENPWVQKIKNSAIAQGLINSYTWRKTKIIVKKEQDFILNHVGMGGSLISAAVGGMALMTSFAILPAVAASGLLSTVMAGGILATSLAASYLVSGGIGVYLTGKSLWHQWKDWYQKKKTRREKKEPVSTLLNTPSNTPSNTIDAFPFPTTASMQKKFAEEAPRIAPVQEEAKSAPAVRPRDIQP